MFQGEKQQVHMFLVCWRTKGGKGSRVPGEKVREGGVGSVNQGDWGPVDSSKDLAFFFG